MQELPGEPKSNSDPKLSQFIEEVNALSEKYQYQLKPQLQITGDGVIPTITVVNEVPPKPKEKIKKITKDEK